MHGGGTGGGNNILSDVFTSPAALWELMMIAERKLYYVGSDSGVLPGLRGAMRQKL